MPAGRLRERVTLQQRDPAATPNSYNEQPDQWVALLSSEPAEVYALSGREYVAAQQVQGAVTHRVMLRTPTRVAIKQEHRFLWTERLIGGTEVSHVLDIKQVTPLVRQRGYTECLCTEHVGG
jgi:head-tail adaptor